jgi:site-specific recombinase XerC
MKQKAALSPLEAKLLTTLLRSSFNSGRFLGVRHYAMLLVADCARLHFNELLSLRMFQLNGAVIQSLDGFKGVLLNPEAQSALNAYLELRSKLNTDSKILFVGLNGGPLPSVVMRNRIRKFGLRVLGREIEPERLLRGLRHGARFDLSRLKEIHHRYHPRGKSA